MEWNYPGPRPLKFSPSKRILACGLLACLAILVVEFLIEQFGLENLQAILRDLGAGVGINEAIEAHTAPLEDIEEEFSAFAQERAEKLAPGLDWEKPKPSLRADEDWVSQHPTNYYALTRQARRLLAGKKFAEAEPALNRLIELN